MAVYACGENEKSESKATVIQSNSLTSKETVSTNEKELKAWEKEETDKGYGAFSDLFDNYGGLSNTAFNKIEFNESNSGPTKVTFSVNLKFDYTFSDNHTAKHLFHHLL